MRILLVPLLLLLAAASAHPEAAPDAALPKVVLLVLDLQPVGVAPHEGKAAAEMLASRINASSLARAVRPKTVTDETTVLDAGPVRVEDASPQTRNRRRDKTVEIHGDLRRIESERIVSLPDSDYVLEGTLSVAGELRWIRVTLKERAPETEIASAAASADRPESLPKAAAAVLRKLEPAYAGLAVHRRVEALMQLAESRTLGVPEVARQLEALHSDYPDLLAPCAARLALLLKTDPPDAETVTTWARKLTALLPKAGIEGERILLQFGVDPYDALAKIAESSGALDDAVAARRAAIHARTGPAWRHWMEIARLETARGRPAESREALRSAARLRPGDAALQLRCGDALWSAGDSTSAAEFYRLYLQLQPVGPDADRLRARFAETALAP